jgi:hypothetical protein
MVDQSAPYTHSRETPQARQRPNAVHISNVLLAIPEHEAHILAGFTSTFSFLASSAMCHLSWT